ncbi:MAG: LamG domain-containing protein [Verrucomicrobiales bacterium]|nr:LamG domain-containing protein [Verrucomicrobiales bacterium]
MMKKIAMTLALATLTLTTTAADEVPLVAALTMTPAGQPPLELKNAELVQVAERGAALQLNGTGFAEVKRRGLIDRMGMELSITAWIKMDRLPDKGKTFSITAKGKQGDMPFQLGVFDNGALFFKGGVGGADQMLTSRPNMLTPEKWQHVAVTYKTGDNVILYINDKEAARAAAKFPLQPNDQSLFIGNNFSGQIGALTLYARALTVAQLDQDQNGGLATRPATVADLPPVLYRVKLSLGRFDMPAANTIGYGRIHQIAQRQDDADAVDWPQIALDGELLFQEGDKAEEVRFIRKRTGKEAMSKFEQEGDCVIEPGHHWLRPLAWRWGRNYVYTDDRYARSWSLDYELLVFPVIVSGTGAADVRDVELKYQGRTIYQQPGPFHSLTLLLPASAPKQPYTLTVAGRAPVDFEVGLQPVQLGNPKDVLLPLNVTLPGAGPKISVQNLDRPATFPHQADWDKDVAALDGYAPDPFDPALTVTTMRSRLGISVPRSPLTVNAISLSHGMSGGFFYNGADGHGTTRAFAGTPDEYGAYLADTGYDRVFEFTSLGGKALPAEPRSHDAVAAALARAGVQLGLVPGNGWFRPCVNHANINILAWALPDFHQPLYRSLQVQAQRFQRYGNFAGVNIGADNGGYVSYWHWAPPIPDRPWPEAMNAFFQGQPVRIPVSAAVTDGLDTKEYRASAVREVIDYLAKYDETFTILGYFNRALKEAAPAAQATCGMFGSSPGGLGRGGWPMGTVPGKRIFSGLEVMQAYDWNEYTSSLPLHNVALLDRLRSDDPLKPTWALLDDFNFLMLNRGLRQRAYALALTRGVQAVGTTFLPNPTGDRARPDIIADQKEWYAWMHRYGGAYAMSKPLAAIGILYVHPQSLLRGIVSDAQILRGSHEGKTTEALFLCHAAGWPARLITPDELQRGLDAGMKTILLVGLNQFDDSWVWHEGLADALKQFVNGGGQILLDDESVCPVPATATDLSVSAYVPQSLLDPTPLLLERNAANIEKLRAVMARQARPVCVSTDPTVWAVPALAGDVQYVTVVNQLMETVPLTIKGKQEDRRVMKGQTGAVTWNTTRPIYDVRQRRQVSARDAGTVDLTREAFQWYALPPRPVTAPEIALSDSADGYQQVLVTISGTDTISGIPVELVINSAQETVTIHTATGLLTRLPVKTDDAFGACAITATELLSGLSAHATLTVSAAAAAAGNDNATIQINQAGDIKQFAARRQHPLTVALTDQQAANPEMRRLAETVAAYYRDMGREVELSRAEPNQLVLNRQPYVMTQPYPQWKTAETDLVLFGSPNDNVLLMDQDRGYLLPPAVGQLKPAQGLVCLTFSPFVGECQALNLIARDLKGLQAAVSSLLRAQPAD